MDGDVRNGIKISPDVGQVLDENNITTISSNDINQTHINNLVTKMVLMQVFINYSFQMEELFLKLQWTIHS